MTALPAPLTPADCDLRDVADVPIDFQRLRNSDLLATETPEVCFAAFMLWGASWTERPAGSLPDDDRLLARAAGYGKDTRRWGKVRGAALRHFQKCSDGRFYHPVLAIKVLETWIEKLAYRLAGGEANAKRWGGVFDKSAIETSIVTAVPLLKALDKHSKALTKKTIISILRLSAPQSGAHSPRNPPRIPDASGAQSLELCSALLKKQQQQPPVPSEDSVPSEASNRDTDGKLLPGALEAVLAEIGANGADLRWADAGSIVRSWLDAGYDLQRHVLPTVRDLWARAQRDSKTPRSLRYFTDAIAERHGRKEKPMTPAGTVAPLHRLDAESRMSAWVRKGIWIESEDGPRPGEPGCRVPADIIEKYREKAA